MVGNDLRRHRRAEILRFISGPKVFLGLCKASNRKIKKYSQLAIKLCESSYRTLLKSDTRGQCNPSFSGRSLWVPFLASLIFRKRI